jgi:flagellar protein FlgJ
MQTQPMQAQAMYSDFGALAELRGAARQDADANLEEVAAQFESLFVQMMLKSMRDATMQGGLFDSHQLESYQQMHDQQLSLDISSRGGIGLARVLVEQLQSDRGRSQGAVPDKEVPMTLAPAANSAAAMNLSRYLEAPLATRIVSPTAARTAQPGASRDVWVPTSPTEFAAELQQVAEAAASRLGVEPAVLLAQSALETGWGKHVSADQHGSSNNFFNIKAGADWSGPTVTVQTIEYRDGIAVRESAKFRAYASPAESFADYARLIEGSPRYSAARAQAADGERYLRELQRAGYATDPAYADKVLSILARGDLAWAEPGLKNPANLPLEG